MYLLNTKPYFQSFIKHKNQFYVWIYWLSSNIFLEIEYTINQLNIKLKVKEIIIVNQSSKYIIYMDILKQSSIIC